MWWESQIDGAIASCHLRYLNASNEDEEKNRVVEEGKKKKAARRWRQVRSLRLGCLCTDGTDLVAN